MDDDTDYEPDAVVNCGPPMPADAIAATRPVIVVEVLSPSTQSVDSGEKLAGYFRVPTIQHYLVFGTRRRELVHHARQGDAILSRVLNVGQITLEPPGIDFDLDEIYGR